MHYFLVLDYCKCELNRKSSAPGEFCHCQIITGAGHWKEDSHLAPDENRLLDAVGGQSRCHSSWVMAPLHIHLYFRKADTGWADQYTRKPLAIIDNGVPFQRKWFSPPPPELLG